MIDDKIEEKISKIENLPTLPSVAIKILQTVKKEETSLKEIAEILSKDPPLSAKVLAMINSGLYFLPKKITSVTHAVNLLGIDTVKNLALSFSLIKGYQKEIENNFDYALFWKSSLISAVSAKLLVRHIYPSFADDAFTMGLLHDIGILALNQGMPKQYSIVLKERERILCFYHEIEDQVIGFNHMETGGYLAKKWGLPKTFYKAIQYHHCSEKLDENEGEICLLAKILHLSSLFSDFFTRPETKYFLGLIQYYSEEYGLLSKTQIEELTEQIQKQTIDVLPLFDFENDETDYFEILEEARKELINLSNNYIKMSLEQRRTIEALKQQTMNDFLTGLSNYKGFQYYLEREIYRSDRYDYTFSVILTDVDKFKKINDIYGHLAGDSVLKKVGECLKNCIRKSDIAARYGGDEFAIILPETKPEDALAAAEKIRRTVESMKIMHEGETISITMSFGVASMSNGDDMSNIELVKNADNALYNSKRHGGNSCSIFEK